MVLFSKQGDSTVGPRPDRAAAAPKLQRMAWAKLLKRMGGWDMESCPDCGAQLVVVGVTLDPDDIARALSLRGLLPVTQLDLSPARGPPPHGQMVFDFMRRASDSTRRAA